MCGHEVNWLNLLEAEQDPKKREWLKAFSQPQHLLADVGLLADKVTHNFVSEAEEPTPRSAFLFSFGYSCKDLSTLNNFSHEYKSDCLETQSRSTGVTWAGNLGYIRVARPPMVLIENVVASRRGAFVAKLQSDLQEEGYEMFSMVLNSCETGFPRDRRRACFLALRGDCCSEQWQVRML